MLEECLYIFQAMMPLIASPLYGFLYKRTLETFSGAFILLNVFLYLVVMMMASWVYLAMKKQEVMKINQPSAVINDDNQQKLLKVID